MTLKFPKALALLAGIAAAALATQAQADPFVYIGSNPTLSVTASSPLDGSTLNYSFAGAISVLESTGSVGSVTGKGAPVGTAYGTNYLTAITFIPTVDQSLFPSSAFTNPYGSATVNLGTPTLSGLAAGSSGATLNIALYTGSQSIPSLIANSALSAQTPYQSIVANSAPIGSYTVSAGAPITPNLGSAFTAAVNDATQGSLGGLNTVTLVVTSAGSGLGTPAPVAGAGVPFLAAVGALLARRRRRARAA